MRERDLVSSVCVFACARECVYARIIYVYALLKYVNVSVCMCVFMCVYVNKYKYIMIIIYDD